MDTTKEEQICKELERLRTQIQCGAKSHDMRFSGGSEGRLYTSGFPFTCWRCGLEIVKTYQDITAEEKVGFKALRLFLRIEETKSKGDEPAKN